ncbi:MAG: chemotaxis protein CheD [Spirochaetes bacterium]|nr:chemotaxis protein CheD [Spirochaetota bacterium]
MISITRNSADKPVKIIYAGEVFASDEDVYVETLLGSCIAVVLHDSTAGLSGMNHFMFPGGATDKNPRHETARYGSDAILELIAEMIRKGADRNNLIAKIFGGGHVLKEKNTPVMIPENNIRLANAILEMEDIPVVERNVGRNYSRKIQMNVKTGEVKCIMSEYSKNDD